jgi:hypothetical protein
VDRIAVLADRGDIAFVELDCPVCGSRTVSVVVGPERWTARPATEVRSVLEPVAEVSAAGARPLVEADVVEMRRFLAGWEGDLRTLLDDDGPRAPGAPESTT